MPELRADPLLRWARGLLTAAVALSAGAVAHVAAGGLMPALPELLALLGLTWLVAGALLGRPASRARLVALVVAGQAAAHLAFAALAGHSAAAAPSSGSAAGTLPARLADVEGPRRGSLYDLTTGTGLQAGDGPGLPAWVAHLVADLTGPQAWMTLAHALAAAALGWWLAVGERALWSLVCLAGSGVHATAEAVRRRARAALGAALAVVAAATRPAPPRAVVRARTLEPWRPAALRVVGSPLVRRGPPVAA